MELYLVNVKELEDFKFPLLEIEIKEYNNLSSKKRKLEWRVSRWLRRRVLSDKLGMRPEELVFSVGANGRPFLLDHEDIDFNISHSGIWLVMLVSSQSIGIDIESYQENRNVVGIAKNYFLLEEYLAIMNSSNANFLFHQLWTLKESYVKATGEGIANGFKKYGFNISEQGIEPLFLGKQFFFGSYSFHNTIISISSIKPQSNMLVKELHATGLFEKSNLLNTLQMSQTDII
jgi:phosphopantetheinyl transferase